MLRQRIFSGKDAHKRLESILKEYGCKRYFLVCDKSFQFISIKKFLISLDISYEIFSDFSPNPCYEDVCKGVLLFRKTKCDVIVAVGGGSTIDVAKCIKLYCKMDDKRSYLEQEYCDTTIPLIAVPTTAGTGSESTCYAVMYYEGQKQSIMHDSILPDYALLEASVLKTLPLYQKKCTLLDALCQGIESWWSVNSTEESKAYSRKAVEMIIRNMDAYLEGDSDEVAEAIMVAANYSGRAINITQTTAAHAMSYKVTSLYGIPHGHAVAICLPVVWRYMIEHTDDCVDSRGKAYLVDVFQNIAQTMGADVIENGVVVVETILQKLQMERPIASKEEVRILAGAVNPTRLCNNPVKLSEETLLELYKKIVK